jgi:hypothetical protein
MRMLLLSMALLLCACGARSSLGRGGDGAGEIGTCEGLEQQYASALEQARVCVPQLRAEQCTRRVADRLACACLTYVNRFGTEAVAELGRLQQQWIAAGCEPETCPTVGCVGPHAGECVSDDEDPMSRSGHCESNR